MRARRKLPPPLAPLLLLLSVTQWGGCGEEPSNSAPTLNAPLPTVAQDPVVARVDGHPIYASDVRARLASGEDHQQALDAMVRRELLAREARRRNLHTTPPLKKVLRSALAESLIHHAFGASFDKSKIPAAMIARSFKLNRGRFQHPELVHVRHILAKWNRKMPAALQERARIAAQEVHRRATEKPLDPKAFAAIADQLRKSAAPIELRAEKLRTPRKGFTVPSFANAAFALERKGAVSPVVKTSYGFHVIYLLERLPAVHKTLEQADSEIREQLFDEARQLSFDKFAKGIERKHGVVFDFAALGRSLAKGE